MTGASINPRQKATLSVFRLSDNAWFWMQANSCNKASSYSGECYKNWRITLISSSYRLAAALIVALGLALGTGLPTQAQDPAQSLFTGVKALYVSSQSKAESDRIEDYRGMRRLLDLIVQDHPSSDLAVAILLEDTIKGVNVAEINAALEADAQRAETESTLSETQNTPASVAVAPEIGSSASSIPNEGSSRTEAAQAYNAQNTAMLSQADQSSENALSLDRRAIRDIQSRLTVLGQDPNGIDGVVGKGTRAALGRWQATNGLLQTGYLNAGQLELLKANSQAALDVWLQNKRNAELYSPSPKRASSQRGLRNGWYMRNGKYCKKVQFGLQYCTPKRPPDA